MIGALQSLTADILGVEMTEASYHAEGGDGLGGLRESREGERGVKLPGQRRSPRIVATHRLDVSVRYIDRQRLDRFHQVHEVTPIYLRRTS